MKKAFQIYKIQKQADGKFSLLNYDNIVLCTYDYIGAFLNGIAVVKKGSFYSAINEEGERIIPYYSKFRITSNGYSFD